MKNLTWLNGPAPHRALAQLRATGALRQVLPEVDALYGVPQSAEHHPEICTGIHTEMCLEVAERLGLSPQARFAVLVHDLGKALTPAHEWPRHLNHESKGMEPVREVCERLGITGRASRLALLVCRKHLDAHRAFVMRERSVISFLEDTAMEQDRDMLVDFVGACEADKRGRLGMLDGAYPQGTYLLACQAALAPLPHDEGAGSTDASVDSQKKHVLRLQAVRTQRLLFAPPDA